MFLFAAILFVLLTHLQVIGLLMITGSLIWALALYLTRPTPERTPSTINVSERTLIVDDEEHTDYEYPHAA
jgi:hypothetical protein